MQSPWIFSNAFGTQIQASSLEKPKGHPAITTKLETGDSFTRADWDEVKKFEIFKPGLQFIDGYLVYLRPK